MRGSSTIALAELARNCVTVLAEHRLGVRLDAAVDRREEVLALPFRRSAERVDRLPGRITDDRLASGTTGELAVVLELEPSEPFVVGACEADHRRGDGVLRVGAPLLRIRADAGEVLGKERVRRLRLGEAGDVDEVRVLAEELRVELVRVRAEEVLRGERDRPCVGDRVRVGIDRPVLLADRELNAGAVDDRAAPRRRRHRLLVHLLRLLAVGGGVDDLQPRGAAERDRRTRSRRSRG